MYLQGKERKKLTGQVFRYGRRYLVECLIEKVKNSFKKALTVT